MNNPPKISIIVAMAKHNVIGGKNTMLWHLPKDFKHFKQTTTGKPIIMGRKTLESLPSLLPNRFHIVVSSSAKKNTEQLIWVSNFDEAIKKGKEYAHNNKIDELFIIGGGLIYKQAIDMVDRLYVTKVDLNIDGDTYFPKIDEKIWKLDSDKKEDDYDKISKKNVKITIEKWIKK